MALLRLKLSTPRNNLSNRKNDLNNPPTKPVWLAVAGFTLAGLTACSINPAPITEQENKARVAEDSLKLQQEQEKVSGPITLHEAVARALKYNLDYRVELMHKTLAQEQLDISHYDMLPKFVGSLGVDARNNWSGASSRSLLSGRQSLEPSTSSDRDVFNAKLGLTWNIVDFGVSYFRAHQAGDKVMAREEEKRKVVNRIVQDVITAYWRTVSNERLKADMQALAGRIDVALAQSKQALTRKLLNPMGALTYQRELLSIQRELEQLQRTLALSKVQLAALMNIKPGEDFHLVVPERNAWTKNLTLPPDKMEQIALENRPEIRALVYEKTRQCE
ncbi:TolC family protein [Methylocucumis oryzae]|uniref:TolC family protein n=1 Tax=Methylocucumis oryzae TaxID=1632867 RepID=UPI0006962931|nr:TolC family protein [Methylocucumis oryzae]